MDDGHLDGNYKRINCCENQVLKEIRNTPLTFNKKYLSSSISRITAIQCDLIKRRLVAHELLLHNSETVCQLALQQGKCSCGEDAKSKQQCNDIASKCKDFNFTLGDNIVLEYMKLVEIPNNNNTTDIDNLFLHTKLYIHFEEKEHWGAREDSDSGDDNSVIPSFNSKREVIPHATAPRPKVRKTGDHIDKQEEVRITTNFNQDEATKRKQRIVESFYNNPAVGFKGRDKLTNKLQRLYWGISRQDVGHAILNTTIYQRTLSKPNTFGSSLQPYGIGHHQIDCTFMRNKGKVAPSNPIGFCVIVDRFSRFVWTFPIHISTPNGDVMSNTLKEIWLVEGPPVILQSDGGGEFRNTEVGYLCEMFYVQQVFSKSHHPQANGAVERVNQTLKRSLYKVMALYQVTEWWKYLPYVTYAYNTSVHRSTGYAPFAIHRGFMPVSDTKAFEGAMPRVRRAQHDSANRDNPPKEGEVVELDKNNIQTIMEQMGQLLGSEHDNPGIRASVNNIRNILANKHSVTGTTETILRDNHHDSN